MYHYTYQITNLINNKIYYGVRSCKCLPEEDIKYWGSGIAIKHAITKYGKENFSKKIDKTFETRGKASLYEAEIVTKEWVEDRTTYNMKTGGMGGIHCEEIKMKISQTLMGHFVSSDTRDKISKANNGYKHSEESKRNMSVSKRGEKHWNYGKHHSEETKHKMSKAKKGEKHWNYGKHRSEETKRKIGNANRGNIHTKEQNIIRANRMSQYWLLISPEDDTYIIKNLRQFCRDNNLDAASMSKVSQGKRNHHKGWKCKKLE